LTETELIHALHSRQEDGFRILVERYKDRMYNTLFGLLQNETDAEDLVQDVFIKVFEKIHSYKGEAALGTWIYRIAVTHSLDFLRRKSRKKRNGLLRWFGNNEGEEIDTPEFNHPGVLAENKERAAHLFKAMQRLPENQRIAFVLQKVEGLPQREIAAIMDLKEGAVESLLSRAKANLKQLLHQYYAS